MSLIMRIALRKMAKAGDKLPNGGTVMFDPRDNPQQYMRELQEMAQARLQRMHEKRRKAYTTYNDAANTYLTNLYAPDSTMTFDQFLDDMNNVKHLKNKLRLAYQQESAAERGFNNVRPGVSANSYISRQGWNK